jgi:hypothetical protein
MAPNGTAPRLLTPGHPGGQNSSQQFPSDVNAAANVERSWGVEHHNLSAAQKAAAA